MPAQALSGEHPVLLLLPWADTHVAAPPYLLLRLLSGKPHGRAPFSIRQFEARLTEPTTR